MSGVKIEDNTIPNAKLVDNTITPAKWNQTEPGVPTDLTATSGVEQTKDGIWMAYINASWTANTEDDFHGYEVAIRPTAGGNWKYKYFTNNEAKIFPLISNIEYEIQVRAIDKQGNKSVFCVSFVLTSAKDESAPNTVTGLTAIAGIQYTILEWTHSTAVDLSHYEIYKNTVNNSGTATKIAECKLNSFVAGNLTADQIYYFWIKAKDLSGNISDFSTQANATPRNVGTTDVKLISASKILIDGVVYLSNWRKTGDLTKIDGGELSANTVIASKLIATLRNFADFDNTLASANQLTSRINTHASTLILPGKIVVSGATTLADWRGTDQTKIEGGELDTGTVTLEKLVAKLSNNLLHNTSFESWTYKGLSGSWSPPITPYWVYYEFAAGGRAYLQTSLAGDWVIEGNCRLVLQNLTSNPAENTDARSTLINIKPSTKYTLSAYLIRYTGTTNPEASINVLYFDAGKNFISSSEYKTTAPVEYERWTLTVTSPANAYFVAVSLKAYATATGDAKSVVFDCPQFEEGGEATPWNEAGQTIVHGGTMRTGNIILDGDTENYVLVKDKQATPKDRVKLGKIGAGLDDYGLVIYDASGNLLVNLYNSSNFRINAPVFIAPAYVKAWELWPANGTRANHTHNLGYIPSHRQGEGRINPVGIDTSGVPAGEDYIVPQEFYAAMDIEWVSETKFRTYHLTAPGGKCDQWRARFLR